RATATGTSSNRPLTDRAGTRVCMPSFQTEWVGWSFPAVASCLSWAAVMGPCCSPSMSQYQSAAIGGSPRGAGNGCGDQSQYKGEAEGRESEGGEKGAARRGEKSSHTGGSG